MYTAELRDEVSQGDIFNNFPVVDIKFEAPDLDPKTATRRARVILISYDCDYDHGKGYVMVAEVRPLTDVDNQWC